MASSPHNAGVSRTAISAAVEARLAAAAASSSSASSGAASDAAKHAAAAAKKETDLDRLIERGLIGPNSYLDAEKAISVLQRLTDNILGAPADPAKRILKGSSKVLTSTLAIKGAQDVLVALGWRKRVVDFVECWALDITEPKNQALLRPLEVLEMGSAVISRKAEEVKKRAEKTRQHSLSKKEEEELRTKEALALIEHDREKVKERAAREAFARHRKGPPSPVQIRSTRSQSDMYAEEEDDEEAGDSDD